jgi:hypothetical protein
MRFVNDKMRRKRKENDNGEWNGNEGRSIDAMILICIEMRSGVNIKLIERCSAGGYADVGDTAGDAAVVVAAAGTVDAGIGVDVDDDVDGAVGRGGVTISLVAVAGCNDGR